MPVKTLIPLLSLLLVCSSQLSHAQESPYEISWEKDGPWLGASLAGTTAGFLIIQNKKGFTEQELAALSNNSVNSIDRYAIGNFDEDASKKSDIPFYTSFAIPLAMLATSRQNDHAGQLSLMYLESLTTTAALFTLSAGLTNRARPKAYNTELSLGERMEPTNTRSFYSGHVAASATSTFFAAKVFNDFYPESDWKWVVWGGAAAIPA
ncbi:MAG: phosphatase PAP2 family protein, partial [Nonlabens sp.]|nr:phosphatase PAP2 family protein [Nonlabens sp.]